MNFENTGKFIAATQPLKVIRVTLNIFLISRDNIYKGETKAHLTTKTKTKTKKRQRQRQGRSDVV